MTDKITITNMAFYAHHGVLDEEAKLGQRFYVDLVAELDLSAAGESDDYSKAVCYGQLYDAVAAVVHGPRAHLIEAIAERCARAVLDGFPPVQGAIVTVRKPSAPIVGNLDHVSVTVTRRRGAAA
ncbi:dihydroneopterin aldolase [Segnochrobactrum spirostomi]|uniref:7,8-dihydroneopterin aldolase n=1 Tax=Segnochrobactrum spirostomi TaxID=2608987 RepID=A0A6A7XXU0_9HYPH|nr:dihydroneopterin aldolase [Segnochrobactrum spirostomi]MQT11510.1 dihydroneopterin aldolase [Segnochrobactrum spirostomi]